MLHGFAQMWVTMFDKLPRSSHHSKYKNGVAVRPLRPPLRKRKTSTSRACVDGHYGDAHLSRATAPPSSVRGVAEEDAELRVHDEVHGVPRRAGAVGRTGDVGAPGFLRGRSVRASGGVHRVLSVRPVRAVRVAHRRRQVDGHLRLVARRAAFDEHRHVGRRQRSRRLVDTRRVRERPRPSGAAGPTAR